MSDTSDIVERIEARVHDAPIPSEYLLDEAAATITALRDRLEKAEGALRDVADSLQRLRAMPGDGADGRLWQRIYEIRNEARAYFAAQEATP